MLLGAVVLAVHDVPLAEYITRCEAPESATATNIPFPYVTDFHRLVVVPVRITQLMPLIDVITLAVVVVAATATNVPSP